MRAGLAVARRAIFVCLAVAAEAALCELRTIAVPLKDDNLAPIVPKRRENREVLADRHIAGGRCRRRPARLHDRRQPGRSTARSVDPRIIFSKAQEARSITAAIKRR